MKTFKIKIEISARHCHLNEKDFKKIFGKNASLTPFKDLSQEGEFSAKETIVLKTKKDEFSRVRIIGPLRKYTQIEIAGTDAIKLGLNPPVRMSGNLLGASSAILQGPSGEIKKKEGIILANRHIHASFLQAKKYGLRNGQIVRVKVKGARALTFDKVEVKLNEKYDLSMHIDTDEANACGITSGNNFGKVIIK